MSAMPVSSPIAQVLTHRVKEKQRITVSVRMLAAQARQHTKHAVRNLELARMLACRQKMER